MENNSDRMGFALIALSVVAFGLLAVNGTLQPTVDGFFKGFNKWETATFAGINESNKQDVTHTAYSWSNDGTDGFTTTKPNLNLLDKTNQGVVNWDWALSDGDKSVEEVNIDGIHAVKLIKGTTTANTGWNYIRYDGLLRNLIQPSTQYVLSFDVKPSVDVRFIALLARGDSLKALTDGVTMNKASANQWTKVSCILTSKETLPDDLSQTVYLMRMSTENGNWLIIKNIKLEQGSVATPCMPSASEVKPSDQPKYIGTYTDKSDSASQDPKKYTWKSNPDYHE